MSKQDRIMQKQNEQAMLENQYAARYYYNQAEKLSDLAFLFSFVSVIFLLLPNNVNSYLLYFAIGLPIVCDAISFLFYYQMSKDIKNAALLRNFFDSKVLEINAIDYSEEQLRKINDLTAIAIKKDISAANIQIMHNGRDNPPGVKDWYEFSRSYSDKEVVHECQRINLWWDKSQQKFKAKLFILLLIIILISIIILLCHGMSPWRIFICFISLIVTSADRINCNYKYIQQSIILEGMSKNADLDGNDKQIECLQKNIEKRREIPVLGINFYHKKKSKYLAERYETMTKE